MNTINITRNGKVTDIQLTGSWNEMSKKQLLSVSGMWPDIRRCIDAFPAAIIYYRIRIMFVLASLSRWNIFSRKLNALMSILPGKKEVREFSDPEKFIEKYEYLALLLDTTDFIFESPVLLTKNNFPVIKAGSYVLYGPADEMMGMVQKEFIFADAVFAAWVESRDEKYLNELVAILYRPKGKVDVLTKEYTGDQRCEFNNLSYDLWKSAVAKLPMKIRQAIALFYQGCRQSWEVKYPNVFEKVEKSDIAHTHQSWYDVMRELPGEKFGTISEREYVAIDTVLSELERTIIANKTQEK